MAGMIQMGRFDLGAPDSSELKGGDLGTFYHQKFETPFPPGSNVVVIPFVQTFNGAHTPGLRVADVDENGFMIRMNELVVLDSTAGKGSESLSDGKHVDEEIGWIAFTTN